MSVLAQEGEPTKRDWGLCAKILSVVAVVFLILLIGSTRAKADIFAVEQASSGITSTSCPNKGNIGSGLCNTVGVGEYAPYSLTALLSAGITGITNTTEYVVYDDLSSTFSFGLNSDGQNGTGVASNGSCQIKGGATAWFNMCTVTDALGQTTSLGGTQINNLTFPATITFGGTSGKSQVFLLEFVSMQGTSETVPEGGSTAVYLVLDISALLALGWLRHSRRASKFPNVASETAAT